MIVFLEVGALAEAFKSVLLVEVILVLDDALFVGRVRFVKILTISMF